MKVYIETFGCQMNRLDEELVRSQLVQAGHEMIGDRKAADAVLYITCSVRKHAEDKVFSYIGTDAQRKDAGKDVIIGVLGCMAQRLGTTVFRRGRGVDFICAPGQLFQLPDLLDQAAAGHRGVALDPDRKQHAQRKRRSSTEPEPIPGTPGGSPGTTPQPATHTEFTPDTQLAEMTDEQRMDALDLSRDGSMIDGRSQAFVRVTRGCDNFCSYCIVPFVRGPERSRDPEHVLEEVRRLAGTGRSEITLIGQTVNRYRFSEGDRTVRFADLLQQVAEVQGVRRLRFVTSHPLDFTDDILKAMRDLPNLCEYIHCPPQHGSDRMLKAMNRKYTRAEYDALVDRARVVVPEVVLAGDFIVGFPGETEEDHRQSADLIRRAGFKNSFIFKYSPRPGTAAAKTMSDDIPEDFKKLRNNDLLAVQHEVSQAHHDRQVGKRMEILVEGPSPRTEKQDTPAQPDHMQLVGRTRGDHIVVFYGPQTLSQQYVTVTITDAAPLTLFAEL
ncbi:MAG: MiaB/RimO family radical SAM methylthiotransferase [Phycisphaerae bacterium]